ncbi:MAG: L-serine ammonia-lyase, partial [Hyphomonas sp. 32-62-5]
MLSVLDIFRVGIGPSSSHTVGPIRIGNRFMAHLVQSGKLAQTARIEAELQGSLALTGVGHATPKAVVLGLLNLEPETLDPEEADRLVVLAYEQKVLALANGRTINFDPETDIRFAYDIMPDLHPNGLRICAFDETGGTLADETWYSTGGGFIATRKQLEKPVEDDILPVGDPVRFGFTSAAQLLEICQASGLSIDEVILANEDTKRPRAETEAALDRIAGVMMACIDRGLVRRGELPGGLKVRRRAPEIWQKLQQGPPSNEREQLFDWLNVYA